MRKLRIDQYLSALFILLGLLFYLFNTYNGIPHVVQIVEKMPDLVPVAPVPIFASAAGSEAESQAELLTHITAPAVYVMDVPSASTLLEKNAHEPRHPASTVKLLTALTVLKEHGPNDRFIIEEGDVEDMNKNGLQVGEELYLRDLLKALLITSDNDVAIILAKHSPDGMSGFIRQMNAVAKELHLDQSFFSQPAGFDLVDQQMTARDLAILAREVMSNDLLRGIVGIKETTITDTSGEIVHNLETTNHFLAQEFGIVGVKTGTTDLAGQVLVTQVEKGGHAILIVVMGSEDRFGDTKKIIDWVFTNFEWEAFESGTLN